MASVFAREQRALFDTNGYCLVPGFFSAQETDLLRSAMEQDPAVSRHFYNRGGSEGLATKMVT